MKKILLGIAFALLAAPAFAATCPSYPYTLTNGQTADATQVMANFNSILSCANTNVARAGANSDITSLSGLSTPLSAAQGGTGQSTSIFSSNNTWAGTNTFSSAIVASGGVTGNAATASAWQTARTLSLTGAVTGSISIDGSANGSLATTLTALQAIQVRSTAASGSVNNGDTYSNVSYSGLSFNTTLSNTISGASLATNQVTLPAGTYTIRFASIQQTTSSSPEGVACRLYNVTDSAVVLRGGNTMVPTSASSNAALVPIEGVFTLAGTKALAIQCKTGGSTVNVAEPRAVSDGTSEVFNDLLFIKIG